MTTTVSTPTGGSGTGLYTDATDARYSSMLRYLGAVAYADPTKPLLRPEAPVRAVGRLDECVLDVMAVGVVAAREDAVFKEIVTALLRNHVSAVPVVDARRRVVGVVSEADLLARVSGGHLARPRGHRLSGRAERRTKLHAATARDLMTAPAIVARPDMPIAVAARLAADARVRRLPVVDADGVLVGIVTRADLLRPFLRPDDDIRHDIQTNIVDGSLFTSPYGVDVAVDEGVVTLRGHLERRLMTKALVESVHGVAGVIDVDASALGYQYDDSPTAALSPILY